MTPELAAVLAILGAVVVMFAIDRPRMDAVALMAICALPLTGVIDISEAVAGFSDPNILLIATLFVVGDGLVRTGVARKLGDWLAYEAGGSQGRLIALLMITVCFLGSMMSSTAVTAIFIPVVLRICQRTGTSAGKLMMPLSAGALISGMMTLVATAPNLVVNSELVRRGEEGFHFFSFTPFGLPILGVAVLYMLVARRWLPADRKDAPAGHFRRPRLVDWVERYGLAGREYRLRIQNDSPVIGKTLESMNMRGRAGINIVAIQRDRDLIQPTAKTVLNAGDVMLVDLATSMADQIGPLQSEWSLAPLPLSGAHFTDRSQEIGMAEVFVPADSALIGKTVVDSAIRTRFGFSVIGMRRGTQPISQGVTEEPLRVGDTLLVIGPWKSIRNVQATMARDLVALSLPAEMDEVLPAAGKTVPALLTLAGVVGLMVSGVVPNVHAALLGCLIMGALGCITLESAYRAIDWKTIVLIVGMLPFSIALERTGGVDLASAALMDVTRGLGPRVVLAALFVATSTLGLFISNTATAVLMAPVAMTIAGRLDASPYPFAMIVALAASAAFMTPVSSPVNALVVTPGGYRFWDFVKMGVPFTAIVLILSVIVVPWLMPFEVP